MSAPPALLQQREELHQSHLGTTPRALLEAVAVIARAGARNRHPSTGIPAALADDEQGQTLRTVVQFVTRAAQNPAMTAVPGWAQELMPELVAEVLDLLADEGSVVARLPLARFDLADGIAKVPTRTARGLGAAFRAEGAPIRVGRLSLGTKMLEGRSLASLPPRPPRRSWRPRTACSSA